MNVQCEIATADLRIWKQIVNIYMHDTCMNVHCEIATVDLRIWKQIVKGEIGNQLRGYTV